MLDCPCSQRKGLEPARGRRARSKVPRNARNVAHVGEALLLLGHDQNRGNGGWLPISSLGDGVGLPERIDRSPPVLVHHSKNGPLDFRIGSKSSHSLDFGAMSACALTPGTDLAVLRQIATAHSVVHEIAELGRCRTANRQWPNDVDGGKAQLRGEEAVEQALTEAAPTTYPLCRGQASAEASCRSLPVRQIIARCDFPRCIKRKRPSAPGRFRY